MDSDGLYRLCYERLAEENRRRDHFLTRAGLLLTAIVILAGAAMSVGRLDLLAQLFVRVDVFLFYAFEALVWIGIVLAVVLMVRMIWPVWYAVLPSMTGFLQWRDDYAKQLRDVGRGPDDALRVADNRMLLELSRCVCEATDVNFNVNHLKQQAFNWCVVVLTATTAMLGLALLLGRILVGQGI
jgi:hypothetical protein